MRPTSLLALCCSAAMGACSAAAPRTDAPQTVEHSTSERPGVLGQAVEGDAPPPASAPEATSASDPLPRGDLPRIALPTTADFLALPLPAPNPGRYRSFRELSRIQVGQSYLHQVDLLPGESWLVALSDEEARVRVYERATRRLLGTHAIEGFGKFSTGGLVAWPEGAPRYLVGGAGGLLLVDGATGSVLQQLEAGRALGALRWSPDRRVLLAASSDRMALHFYERSGAEQPPLTAAGSLRFSERVDGFDLSADNALLAVSLYPSNDLVVVDLARGVTLHRIAGPQYAGAVAFSPDGRFLAVGGQGVLLVDLVQPERRAFYSQLDNNVDQVRFSPSGDALVVSSYDGRLRVLGPELAATDAGLRLQLSLLQTLRHAGQANVYGFVFEQSGDALVSVSGDQTIRTFGATAPASRVATAATPPRTFRSLAAWRRDEPAAAAPLPRPAEPTMRDGHYVPSWLTGPARPARIPPGRYACKIDAMYKLRECRVRKDEAGHTIVHFGSDHLLALSGVLYDDGPVVRLEGWLTEPSTVVGCPGCERQPLHAVLRGTGGRWQGLLTFRNYHDPHVPPEPPPANSKIEGALDRFPVVLELRERLAD